MKAIAELLYRLAILGALIALVIVIAVTKGPGHGPVIVNVPAPHVTVRPPAVHVTVQPPAIKVSPTIRFTVPPEGKNCDC